MNNQYLIPSLAALASLAFATAVQGVQVVNFGGDFESGPTSATPVSGSSTTKVTTAVEDDTAVTTVGYRRFIANGAAVGGSGTVYTGPDVYGALYMKAIYDSPPAEAPGVVLLFSNSGINGDGSSKGDDYITVRRNWALAGSLATSITRAFFTFDTGGSFSLDATSGLSLTGGVGTATSDVGRWVVISGGVTYISEVTFDLTNVETAHSTSVYTYTNATPTLWSVWEPDAELGNADSGSFTIAGTALTDITQAGFFFEKIGDTRIAPTFYAFTADLATIPEPGACAVLAGLGALGFIVCHRRRAA